MIPTHLKYTHTHEWFSIDPKHLTVGLTKFIVDKLSKPLFLDLPKIGEEILSDICFGEIESLEMLLDITSPVSGEIVAVNERLYDNLDILSNDPYGHGWLIKFVTTDRQAINKLLSPQEYEKHVNKLQPIPPQKQRKPRSKAIKKRR